MDYGQKGILTMHNHYWECDDVPGYFYCACGVMAIYNRETGGKDVHD
jgi:hypothetical protein